MLAVGDHGWWWASVGDAGYCGGTGLCRAQVFALVRLTCYLLLSEITQVLLLVGRARLIA